MSNILSGRRKLRVAVLGAGALLAAYGYKGAELRRTAHKSFDMSDPPAPGTPEFARVVELLTQAPLREGNLVAVLRNGCEIFPVMLDAIAAAQETISFSTYIWWAGNAAEDVAEALAERARSGLEVRILIDAWGSAKLDHGVVKMLGEAGAEVVWFRPLRWYQLGRANNRMHRRILIIDGRLAFAGGVGLAAEWEGDCERPDLWRETHLRVEGPAVRDILGGFAENWSEATGVILTGRPLPDLQPLDGGVPVLVTRSSATAGSTAVEELFLAAILGAQRRLWITTAYFAPRHQLHRCPDRRRPKGCGRARAR